MARALAAALAVSLLAVAGAGGSGAQAPRLGGTLVFGTQGAQAGLREPPCLNVLLELKCITTGALTPFISQKVLLGAFDAGPDYTWRPRLVSEVDYTTKRPFTLTYHIRPEARWSDGVPVTARGLRLHRSRDPGTDRGAVRSVARRAGAQRARRRREDGQGRPCAPASPAGAGCSGTVLPAPRALGQGPLRGSGRTASTTRRRARRSGVARFSSSAGSAAPGSCSAAIRSYWGRRPRLERLVIRFRMSSLNPADWFRSGEVDVAAALRRRRRLAGGARSPDRARALVELGAPHAQPSAPAATPHSRRRRSARRSPTASTGPPSSGTARSAPADPTLRPLNSVVFLPQSPYYKPNWSRYRPQPATRAAAPRAGGLPSRR